MNLDAVNAVFESVACVLVWYSVGVLRRDRRVLGIYWPQVAWSLVWGLWCLPYYAGVGHTLSFSAALVREVGTLVWLCHLWVYRR